MTTFFIKTFGCRVNQVESQALWEQFLRSGFTPADSFETADICLLNTCTVTHQADKDVEKQIRQILRRNPQARLVLTDAAARDRLIGEVLPLLRSRGYSGLDVDFEYLGAELAEPYAAFLGQLQRLLHAWGLFLWTAAAPKTWAGQPVSQ